MAWKERETIWLSNKLSILDRQEKISVYLQTITAGYLFKDTIGKDIILYVHFELRTPFVKAPFSALFLIQNEKYACKKEKINVCFKQRSINMGENSHAKVHLA